MPLKALLRGQPILAPLLNDREWAELYFQRAHLVLPCCPTAAVQMRGGAGTARIQHFSHTPLPTCAFRGETTAHLQAKVVMAHACAAVGWTVDVEHAEADWRADVLAASGQRRVAFEVQWSRQTLGELEARQARYRAAGVRGCWFVRYAPVTASRGASGTAMEARQDLPVFPLVRGRGQESDDRQEAERVQVDSQVVPLGQAVAALLNGHIVFRTHRTLCGALALELTFYDKSCTRCATRSCLYRIAPSDSQPPLSPCGSRVLLWSDALYHAAIIHAARHAYTTIAQQGVATPLARIEPGVGFRCPHCQTRLAPFLAGGAVAPATRVMVTVALRQPLHDPYPHWCYPQDGLFCAAVTAGRC